MPSNKMRKFRAAHPEMTEVQIEEHRQDQIHHRRLSVSEFLKMHGWDKKYENQEELF